MSKKKKKEAEAEVSEEKPEIEEIEEIDDDFGDNRIEADAGGRGSAPVNQITEVCAGAGRVCGGQLVRHLMVRP